MINKDIEQPIPQRVLRQLREKLEAVLRLFDAEEYIDEIEEIPIANYRVLYQRLPLRIYIYDLEDPSGKFEFDSMRDTSRPRGSVLEVGTHKQEGRIYGYYLYSLQPLPDQYLNKLRPEMREHAAADQLPEVEAMISLDGTYEEIAARLIEPSLPKTFLDEIDISDQRGLAHLLACLLIRMGQASIEKDELIRFVERNRESIEKGALDLLQALHKAAGNVEGGEDQKLIFEYFLKNVNLILGGKIEEIDMKSDRLLWLLYAMAIKIKNGDISYNEALRALHLPANASRISPLTLGFMLTDYASTIGGPQQPDPQYLMLIVDCGLIIRHIPTISAGIVVLSKIGLRRGRTVESLTRRVRRLLEEEGQLNDENLKAIEKFQASEAVPEDDF